MLDSLVSVVLQEGASDLHLSLGRPPFLRVGGYLVPLLKHKELGEDDIKELLAIFLSDEDQKMFAKNMEVDFSYSHEKKARFRGHAYVQQGKISIALRYITQEIRTFEDLNLPEILKELAGRRQGFFLTVGPVGHGKTTTLAAMIQYINESRAEHIVTIVDPIEYVYPAGRSVVDQREVRIDTPSFNNGLHAVFREDVDVLMIGEMRGMEAMRTAVTAAETGHLVCSTLHTNNAPQTIDRIIDSFPAGQQDQIRSQLAGSLMAIFSQRLIPRVSGGMIPAYELLINNSAVSNLIREGRTHEINTVIETGTESGMIDINRTLAELVRAGEVTIENARLYSPNPNMLEKFV